MGTGNNTLEVMTASDTIVDLLKEPKSSLDLSSQINISSKNLADAIRLLQKEGKIESVGVSEAQFLPQTETSNILYRWTSEYAESRKSVMSKIVGYFCGACATPYQNNEK